jgi:hypothetical protein
MFEFAFVGIAGGATAPIEVPTSWGSATGSPSPATSATQTLTIVNSPRDVRFNFTDSGTIGKQYQKNGGAWTTITDGLTVSFATGDTLAMRVTGANPGDFSIITTKDDATSVAFGGAFTGSIG